MAFSYVGGNFARGTNTSASITHGLTISEGDLVVAYINRNGSIPINNDAGGTAWTEAGQATPTGETARHALFWKIAGAAEPATYSWSLNGNDLYQVILKVFSSTTDAVVDSAANLEGAHGSGGFMVIEASSGAVISDNAVSVVFGGKDNRAGTGLWVSADQSYTGVLGSCQDQDTAGAHRIFTTGTTLPSAVILDDDGATRADNAYSAHISFVESTGGPTEINISGISSQDSEATAALRTGLNISGVSEQESEITGNVIYPKRLVGLLLDQSLAIAKLTVGQHLSALLEQTSEAEATIRTTNTVALSALSEQESEAGATMRIGVPLAGFVYADSSVSGTLYSSVSVAGTSAQGSEATATLRRGIPLVGTIEQEAEATASVTIALALSGLISQASEATATVRVGAGFFATSSQASEATGKLTLGLHLSGSAEQGASIFADIQAQSRIAGISAQEAEVLGTIKLQTGQQFAGVSQQDSEAVGALGVAISLSATSTTTSEFLGSLGLAQEIPLSGSSQQASEASAFLIKESGSFTAVSDQDSDAAGSLGIGLRISGLSAQSSQFETSFITLGLSLSTVSSQSSQVTAKLNQGIRIKGESKQGSSVVGAPGSPDRLIGSILFFSEVENAPLRFAGQLISASEQASEVVGTLKYNKVFSGLVAQETSIAGKLKVAVHLQGLPVNWTSQVQAQLIVPALNSTGWLTASDIFLHNSYYESLTVSRITASDIALRPSLNAASIKLKPE